MRRIRQFVVIPTVVVATALSWATDNKSHHRPAQASEEVRLDTTPALVSEEDSAPPLTPEQMPPQPPQVTYLDGQLLVIANNSTLADILSAISSRMGAVIDVPAANARERVFGRMGPGPVRNVLAALLTGSQFDYVIVAPALDPARVEQVILIAKGSTPETPASVKNPAIAVNRPGRMLPEPSSPEQRQLPQIVPETNPAPQQTAAPEPAPDDEANDDDSEPTTEQISEGQEPVAGDGAVLPAPTVFPPPGSAPQQPGDGAASPPQSPAAQSPAPRPPHN